MGKKVINYEHLGMRRPRVAGSGRNQLLRLMGPRFPKYEWVTSRCWEPQFRPNEKERCSYRPTSRFVGEIELPVYRRAGAIVFAHCVHAHRIAYLLSITFQGSQVEPIETMALGQL